MQFFLAILILAYCPHYLFMVSDASLPLGMFLKEMVMAQEPPSLPSNTPPLCLLYFLVSKMLLIQNTSQKNFTCILDTKGYVNGLGLDLDVCLLVVWFGVDIMFVSYFLRNYVNISLLFFHSYSYCNVWFVLCGNTRFRHMLPLLCLVLQPLVTSGKETAA